MIRIVKTTFMIGLTCTLMCGSAVAQEAGFDLSSQRSELQHVRPVPAGNSVRSGCPVNPVPHHISVDGTRSLNLARGLDLKDRHGKFAGHLDFIALNAGGVRLTVDFGGKAAAKNAVKAVSGAYVLKAGDKGISITGYDERGAFYGIQTLRQLVSGLAGVDGKLPYCEINDYPDLADRGVVEGFYGTPWSHEVRLSLIDFYGKFKMNSYLYGPKDDPYHSCPDWRLPYPEKEAGNIRELIQACRRNYVDFVWAIHPGQDIKWNEEDYQNLINKFNSMYGLGVRHFAIFFDDISGDGTDPAKQAALLNRLTEDFVKAKGDVGPLTVCPTDYSRLWADPTPKGSLAVYGRSLFPDIKVFWTGDVVCSDLTRETLEFVDSRIGRPAFYWWNYPVTDYARNYLLQGPVYGLDVTLSSDEVCGLVSNPMEHGEASKLALYGVADYTWNIASYDAMDNWERGLSELMPDAREAYRTFAIHSCDTETGYRRDESWETVTFRLDEWDDVAAAALEKEFSAIEAAPAVLESGCGNDLLLGELRPWLEEFGKLGTRGRRVIGLARVYLSGHDDAAFWNGYVHNLMNAEDRKAYEAHKSGTMKLQPFYENMMDDMAHGFLKGLSGEVPKDYKGIGSFANSFTVQTKLMLDNDTLTHYTSGMAQRDGDWIGVDLRAVREVAEVSVLQGRNSVDDVDYFDHAVLEASEDGREWKALSGELDRQYVIHWKGEPVNARYVRLRRLDSGRTNYAAVRSFVVNPLYAGNLGFGIEAQDAVAAVKAFDSNCGTSFMLDGRLRFDVKDGAETCCVLLNEHEVPLAFMQYDAEGALLSSVSIDSPFARITLEKCAASVVLEGSAEVFEIVQTVPCHD